MKVLVTGISGYIGLPLGAVLEQRHHQVSGLDTGFYSRACLLDEGYPIHRPVARKDIRQITGQDVAGYEAVLHLGELSNDPLGQLNPELTYAINHAASVRLAQLCKEAGVSRFIYSSSCSVYGLGSGEFKDEESPLNPQTAYAACKARVEQDVSRLADDRFSPTFLRNATAFGPAPRFRFDVVLNNLSGLAATAGEIRLNSDGSPWRPLVHVLDIAQAFACVLEAPREAVHNQVFNVGATAENYRVREIAEIVARAFPGCPIHMGNGDKDSRSYRVSFEKIRHALPGFACSRTAADGARELRELFDRLGLSRELFEHRAFTRIKQILHLRRTNQINQHLFWN